MGFLDRVIARDERVVLHLHPHWKMLVLPFLGGLLAAPAAALLALTTPWPQARDGLLVGGAVLVVLFTVWPLVTWLTTHIVFTTHRVIIRSGVFTRSGRDIPHGRITDVSFQQTLTERMLRCGTLTVASASEYGQAVLHDIPRVERSQGILYQLVESDRDRRASRRTSRRAARR